MQIAQIKAQSGNSAETEQHLQEAVALIEQMPPTPQRQIMLSSMYQELATVWLMEKILPAPSNSMTAPLPQYKRSTAATQAKYANSRKVAICFTAWPASTARQSKPA
jgi:hypothetical protein